MSRRPRGLLLNDSEVTIPGDSDMIHVVFRRAKFVSNTRHFASCAGAPATHRCACPRNASLKKMSSISLFPQNDLWETEPLFCSCFNAGKIFSNDFKRVPRHAPLSSPLSPRVCRTICFCNNLSAGVCEISWAFVRLQLVFFHSCTRLFFRVCVYMCFSWWASHEHRLGSCEEHHIIAIS